MAHSRPLTPPLGLPLQMAALLAALALFAVGTAAWHFATGIDDAHISFFSAQTLATQGEILNYNLQRVEQSSSLLHVLLTAVLSRLTDINTVTAGYSVPLLSGWLCVLLSWWVASHWASNNITRLAPALLCASATPLVYWTGAGLEAPLATLLLLLYIGTLTRALQQDNPASLIAYLITGLALQLTRPELPLFVPVLTLTVALTSHFTGRKSQRGWTLCALSLATALLIAGWRLQYFGAALPQPVTAKSAGITLGALQDGLQYLSLPFRDLLTAIPAITGTLACLHLLWRSAMRHEPLFFQAVALALAGYAALIVLMGGDWMPQGRFWVTVVPLYALVLARCLALWLSPKAAWAVIAVLVACGMAHNQREAKAVFHADIPDSTVAPHYSPFEQRSPDNRANLPTLAALQALLPSLLQQKNGPLHILSGQMGMIPYHLSLQFPGKLHFTDRNGLVERSLTECSLTRDAPRAPQGIDGLATIFFIKKAAQLQEACGIAPPDVIFDLWWHNKVPESMAMLERQGYVTVHLQEGTTLLQDQLVLVRKALLPDSFSATLDKTTPDKTIPDKIAP